MSDGKVIKSDQSQLNEAISQLRYLQSVYSQQYELLENQISTYTMSIDTISKGVEVLKNKDSITSSNMLINAGPGLYFEGKMGSAKNINIRVYSIYP